MTNNPLSDVKGILNGDMMRLNPDSGNSGKKQHFDGVSDDVVVVYLLKRESEKQDRGYPKSGKSSCFTSISGVLIRKPAKPSMSIGLQVF